MWTKEQILTLLSLVIVTGCCGDIKVGKQIVDVSPLYELDLQLDNVQKLSDIMDVSVFDDLYAGEDNVLHGNIYGNGRITILIYLHTNAQMASDGFQYSCETIPEVTYEGSGSNRYCFSQVVELRESPDSFCQPTGEYNSEVMFLKDRLTIDLARYTGDIESPELEAVVLKIAEAFKK